MKQAFALVIAMALSSAHAAEHSDHCRNPMSQWQSREAASVQVKRWGISPERLKIDDGCYELRGRDGDGNRVELKLNPATLAVLEMEVRFRPGANFRRYLPEQRAEANQPPETPQRTPLITPGTAPRVGQH